MDKFLTRDVWKQANNLTKNQKNKFAAVAYVSAPNIKLSKGDTLICNASDYAIKNGETSAKVLEYYQNKGVKLYSNNILHSKLLLTNSFVVIGSSNSSNNSSKKLIESAILSYNKILLSQSLVFCDSLMQKSKLLEDKDIDELLKIKVIKRPFPKGVGGSRPTQPKGKSYWIVNVQDLKKSIELKEQKFVSKIENELNNESGIEKDDLVYIRMTGNSSFRYCAKEGDNVMQIFKHKDKTITVHPFDTILRVQKNPNWTRFYYDDSINENEGKNWKEFQKSLSVLKISNIHKNSIKRLSEIDANKLNALFSSR